MQSPSSVAKHIYIFIGISKKYAKDYVITTLEMYHCIYSLCIYKKPFKGVREK